MFSSNAKWPDSVCTGNSDNVTTDSHDTDEQATAVCRMLERDGFGGSGLVYPLKTWTEELTSEQS
jgi:hypothetical protein